jgi:predicted nuclease of restriction endonuclease-like (RecB) superfamily
MNKKKKRVPKKLDSANLPAALPPGYADILVTIKTKIKSAQSRAFLSVNQELISTYFEIGETLHIQQQTAGWGDSVVKQLAKDLQIDFPGVRGFSPRNLWRMWDFYRSYHKNDKLRKILGDISWTHHIYILEKCKNLLEREFYIRMSRRQSWSYRVLLNQIGNHTYEKTLASQTNFEKNLPEKMQFEARIVTKDEYAFDFIEGGDEHDERQLESAIVGKIEQFLREMGNVYTFVNSQYRVEIGDKEFLIDILLYNRRLKALVAIELKIGEFLPEHVGKMQFYLSVLDDTVRMKDENPSIGIILCKEKNRTIVEYALRDATKPIHVSTYKFSDLPAELQHELPTVEQISRLLEFIE